MLLRLVPRYLGQETIHRKGIMSTLITISRYLQTCRLPVSQAVCLLVHPPRPLPHTWRCHPRTAAPQTHPPLKNIMFPLLRQRRPHRGQPLRYGLEPTKSGPASTPLETPKLPRYLGGCGAYRVWVEVFWYVERIPAYFGAGACQQHDKLGGIQLL